MDAEAPVPATPKGKILLVEDSLLLREMLAALFRAAGYDIVAMADTQEAIDQASEIDPGLILLNANPPRVDGVMAGRVMRTLLDDASLQIIYIVRPSDMIDVRQLLDTEGDDYVVLPINHEELVGRVKRKFALRSAHLKDTDKVRVNTVSQLMITVAHHMNNSLSSIVARAHIVNPDDPDDVAVMIDVIQSQSKRIQSVVESLIEMANSKELITTDYTKSVGQPMFDIAERMRNKLEP